MIKVAFHTLGCKLNQLETESIADAFAKAGASIGELSGYADLYVVNTCTVTGKAEQKARHIIRQALSQNPDVTVLVTGCYAQMAQKELEALSPRTVVVPGEYKAALLGLPEWLHENWQEHGDLPDALLQWRGATLASESAAADPFAYNPDNFMRHSRPSVKIEDGCNNRCSYCRVCLARGPARSLSAAQLLNRVRNLQAGGKSEVVLTGVNLAQYRDGEFDFSRLLGFLIENTETIRFRISSYEPDGVDDKFLEVFSNRRVQPHIHLSIQSGSDTVLRRMGRLYSSQELRSAVAALRAAREDPFIAADIITGFPGETESEFGETEALCRELDLAWIHAFPFSPRPGTRAFSMRPQIPQHIAGERVNRLMSVAADGKSRYAARWIGSICDVILERGAGENDMGPEPKDEPESESDEIRAGSAFSPEYFAQGHSSLPEDPKKCRCGTTSNYLKAAIVGVPPGYADGDIVRVKLISPGADCRHDVCAEFLGGAKFSGGA